MDLINDMSVFADAIIWGSLMGACRNHMNSELAEVAAKKLLLLEPHNAGAYVLLSNIYSLKGRWADVAKLRKTMRPRKVTKSPGCSRIEMEKEVHMFTGGESKPHIEHQEIVKMLEKLGGMLKEAGYNPDGSFALHDVDDEEKAQSLRHHSEKLAVAYGLLKLPDGMPIRVMKNLYCERERLLGDQFEHLKTLIDISDIVGAKGSIKRIEKGELSVFLSSFSVLTKSLLPLPDKFHGLADIDKRYRQRYVDMIANPEVAVIFKKRAKIISEIRKTVDNAGFVEIGCSVSIKSLFDSTKIVAKWVVRSMDPNIEVGRQMLGPNWCEIQVLVVLEKEQSLMRPYDLLQKFGDAPEGMITWPCHLLKVEEDFY